MLVGAIGGERSKRTILRCRKSKLVVLDKAKDHALWSISSAIVSDQTVCGFLLVIERFVLVVLRRSMPPNAALDTLFRT